MIVVRTALDMAITPCMEESPRVSRRVSCEGYPRHGYNIMHGRESQGKSS